MSHGSFNLVFGLLAFCACEALEMSCPNNEDISWLTSITHRQAYSQPSHSARWAGFIVFTRKGKRIARYLPWVCLCMRKSIGGGLGCLLLVCSSRDLNKLGAAGTSLHFCCTPDFVQNLDNLHAHSLFSISPSVKQGDYSWSFLRAVLRIKNE